MFVPDAVFAQRVQNREAPDAIEQLHQRPNQIITLYLLERSREFRRVAHLRQMGWNNPEGDAYFQKQREDADKCDDRKARFFHLLMKRIGQELHRSTNAFLVGREHASEARILDLCMAPGGFLETSMRHNPGSSALAFSLPVSMGGHQVLLPGDLSVEKRFLDITMLAEDMGVDTIPPGHPDADAFLARQLTGDQLFDLVICDGQTLRTHVRSSYRERTEAARLMAVQLALGLEHLRPGGTMVVLLHKLDAWRTAKLLWDFQKFSSVKLLKPTAGHTKRSSFYMVAAGVQSQHRLAVEAIGRWKAVWEVATFGSEEDYARLMMDTEADVDEMLNDFGPRLIEWGRSIWNTQADALSKASFIRGQS
ncbi:hypothetical protein C2857_002489 [Epichloe festucae Fl1]|uniref:Ribosomal RNA methyltransferase FtsJ domain-containing protein n=1 Tax=Epichloe festucae (strain Fl1) TaxID=877507 RepID=A0A7U3Q1R5_EPIFF|nr:hypothetical protein C2857_002489 [Epichloe festucae Fl1]